MKLPKSIFMVVILILVLPTFSQSAFADSVTDSSSASVTFNNGALTLDHVPNLNFGTVHFSFSDKTHPSQDSSAYVQVSDDRISFPNGWHLKVSAGLFTSGATTLNGAQIILKNGQVSKTTPNSSSTVTAVQTITLDAEESPTPVSVYYADTSNGLGTWVTTWIENSVGQDNIMLSVPGNSMVVDTSYSSALTWTLEDTPQPPYPPQS